MKYYLHKVKIEYLQDILYRALYDNLASFGEAIMTMHEKSIANAFYCFEHHLLSQDDCVKCNPCSTNVARQKQAKHYVAMWKACHQLVVYLDCTLFQLKTKQEYMESLRQHKLVTLFT